MCHRAERLFESQADSVPAGRRFVTGALRRWGADDGDPCLDALDDILLVATELLSNAIKAGPGPVSLAVEGHRDRVEVAVRDDSWAPAVVGAAGAEEISGRGLAIVDCLCSDWGQRPVAGWGKEVWGRLRVGAGSALAVGCKP